MRITYPELITTLHTLWKLLDSAQREKLEWPGAYAHVVKKHPYPTSLVQELIIKGRFQSLKKVHHHCGIART